MSTKVRMRRAARPIASNPNHHLWNNNGTWWVHATVLHDGIRQERIRKSLGTRDIAEARRRRNHILNTLRTSPNIVLSIRNGSVRARTRVHSKNSPNSSRGPPTSGSPCS